MGSEVSGWSSDCMEGESMLFWRGMRVRTASDFDGLVAGKALVVSVALDLRSGTVGRFEGLEEEEGRSRSSKQRENTLAILEGP